MQAQRKAVRLCSEGVDEASAVIRAWLEEARVPGSDVLRVRLAAEELLDVLCRHAGNGAEAELQFTKKHGDWRLRILYGGDRFDPTAPEDQDLNGWTGELLSRTGFLPVWHRRGDFNVLTLQIPVRKKRSELLLLLCVAAAVAIGLLGRFLPAGIREGVSEYVLNYVSTAFLHLLSTFIGLMVFLSVVTGICGIGNASAFNRIGKTMITRYVLFTFLGGAAVTLASCFLFRLDPGVSSGSSGIHIILEKLFGVIPSNPVSPFQNGNTLQIVFLALVFGVTLLLTGSKTEGLRGMMIQANTAVTRCLRLVYVLLPFYILSSLPVQFWSNGPDVLLKMWKPLAAGLVLNSAFALAYTAAACRTLKVKASVLVPKLMPDFLIALTTSSAALAFPSGLEINEKKLGIDPAFSKTALPIGNILFSGAQALLYVLTGAFLAEYYHLTADATWWIVLWIVSGFLALATPPVTGAMISGVAILMVQLGIPEEGLAVGCTFAILVDFFCTAARVFCLHCEMLLQADKLHLLNRDILRKK